MKRIALLIATNFAVMILLSIVISVLGLDRALAQEGLQVVPLLIMASIFGFGGAFISLLISKWMAKWSPARRSSTAPRAPPSTGW